MFSLLTRKIGPIGIDFGTDSIKLMQLAGSSDDLRLQAAAKVDVPEDIRTNSRKQQDWLIQTIRVQLADKPFKSRKAVIAIPARDMFISHLRIPVMNEKHLDDEILIQAREKAAFDVQREFIRYMVVGEVYDRSERKLEVILMAASPQSFHYYMHIIEKNRLEIGSIQVEPFALKNGFLHLPGWDDLCVPTMVLDLGHSSIKVLITHGSQVAFARTINCNLDETIRQIQKIIPGDFSQARKIARYLGKFDGFELKANPRFASLSSENTRWRQDALVSQSSVALQSPPRGNDPKTKIQHCLVNLLDRLCEEIHNCLRYHDLLFEDQPVQRLIFTGGQAKNQDLCKKLAAHLNLRAQLGDPVSQLMQSPRWIDTPDLNSEGSNGDWAVVFGLCLEPKKDAS